MQLIAYLRKLRWMLGTIRVWCLFFIATLLMAHFCQTVFADGPAMGSEKMPPPVVKVAVIGEKEVNPPREYVGRIEAIQAVDLRARVDGYLEQVKFKEGSRVKAGDLLYQIEPGIYRAKVNAAIAKVSEAKTTLMRARQYRERLEAVKTGGVSKTDMETALASEQEAQSRLDESQANLIQSQLDLTYTSIKAPITGRIGATNFTRGNLVGPSSGTLARIIQLNPIRVVYSVSENDLIKGKRLLASKGSNQEDAGTRLVPKIRLSDGSVYPMAGKLEFAGNEVDAATGTVAVRAVFKNSNQLLLPGQYVTVLVSFSNADKKPVVSQAAVIEDSQGRYVFVVGKGNKVEKRRIVTGSVIDTHWAVEDGLAAGETVIVSGIQKVKPGQVVNPMAQSTTQAKNRPVATDSY